MPSLGCVVRYVGYLMRCSCFVALAALVALVGFALPGRWTARALAQSPASPGAAAGNAPRPPPPQRRRAQRRRARRRPRARRVDSPVRLSVTRWNRADGQHRPFRFILRASATEPVDFVGDRRLLRLTVRTGGRRRRRRTCRHPARPQRVDAARIVRLGPAAGGGGGQSWREWIDLRMFCGPAVLAEQATEVTVSYGFRGRGRSRWVWRRGANERAQHRVQVGLWPGLPNDALAPDDAGSARARPTTSPSGSTPSAEATPSAEPPLALRMLGAQARTLAGLRFIPSVTALGRPRFLYLRPDAWSFQVTSPDGGRFRCGLPAFRGEPVRDFYTRLPKGRRLTQRLEAAALCAPGAFRRNGVYLVRPEVTLNHRGDAWGLDAVVGRFVGPAVPVRVFGHRPYIPHSVDVPHRVDVPRTVDVPHRVDAPHSVDVDHRVVL